MEAISEDRTTTAEKTEHAHHGTCFCGAVQIVVRGEPAAMGYCHCESCRTWSAAPVNAFTLWPRDAVQVTRGADQLASYHKSDNSHRTWCRSCGGHVMTHHPAWGLIDVYASVIPQFPYRPAVHVNYAETMLRMRDGLPKLKDLPKEMGGSGIALPD